MAKFLLKFLGDFKTPSLAEVNFCDPALSIHRNCIRGTNGSSEREGTFRWTSAVRALAVLFLKHRLEEEPAGIEGTAGSPAASLDYAISKQPLWLLDMFGSTQGGETFTKRLIARFNPERKRPGPVRLVVNPKILPPENVSVCLNGHLLLETEIKMLLDAISGAGPEQAAAPLNSRIEWSLDGRTGLISTEDSLPNGWLSNREAYFRRILKQELQFGLSDASIFSLNALKAKLNALTRTRSFAAIHPARDIELFDLTHDYSPDQWIGLDGTNLIATRLADREISVSVCASCAGAIAVLTFMAQRHRLNLKLYFRYSSNLPIRAIMGGRNPGALPDLCVSSVPTLAETTAKNLSVFSRYISS